MENVNNQERLTLLQQIKEDVSSVFQRDPAARNTFEVVTMYPGVHAIIAHRLANRLWNKGWRTLARLMSFAVRTISNIDIHPGATIGRRFFIDHGAGVVVGETAVIGNDVTLYHGVTLGGTSWNKGKRHPTLEDGVMVGAGAKVLGPITLFKNSRVGANSVVVKDVPAERTVVGIPGKIVQLKEAGELNPYGIDLNHHLIPDPVGRAMSCLVDRISVLESKLENAYTKLNIEECKECEANEVCDVESSEQAMYEMKKVSGG
ncbi:MAG: serine O-acetyltransferase [Gammaproteobacteria bacterium]|nr:serine O-acetyltransferase [Gammaproteobacteria bacterium]